MTSTSIDGFVDVLETDLRRLAHDARQTEGLASFFSSSNNAPQVVEATERAIDALRRTSDRSLEGGEQSILDDVLPPLRLACSTNSPCLINQSLSIAQKLISNSVLSHRGLDDVVKMLVELESIVDESSQLKLLQTALVLLQATSHPSTEDAIGALLGLCFRSLVQKSKSKTLSSTAAATIRQAISLVFGYVDVSQEMARLEMSNELEQKDLTGTDSNDKPPMLLFSGRLPPLDHELAPAPTLIVAQHLLEDLIAIASGARPTWLKIPSLQRSLILEILDFALDQNVLLFSSIPEFRSTLSLRISQLLQAQLLDYLDAAAMGASIASSASAFRALLRCIRTVLSRYHMQLGNRAGTLIQTLLRGLGPPYPLYQRISIAQLVRYLLSDPSVVIHLFSTFDNHKDRKLDAINALVRTAADVVDDALKDSSAAYSSVSKTSTSLVRRMKSRQDTGREFAHPCEALDFLYEDRARGKALAMDGDHETATPDLQIAYLAMICVDSLIAYASSVKRITNIVCGNESTNVIAVKSPSEPAFLDDFEHPLRPLTGATRASQNSDDAFEASGKLNRASFEKEDYDVVLPDAMDEQVCVAVVAGSWRALLEVFRELLTSSESTTLVLSVLQGHQYFTEVCAFVGLQEPRDEFLQVLCDLSLKSTEADLWSYQASDRLSRTSSVRERRLHKRSSKDLVSTSPKDPTTIALSGTVSSPKRVGSEELREPDTAIVLTMKNVYAMKCLFRVIYYLSNVLDSAWERVLGTVISIDMVLHAPKTSVVSIGAMAKTSSLEPRGTNNSPGVGDGSVLSNEISDLLACASHLFQGTANMTDNAVVALLAGLRDVSLRTLPNATDVSQTKLYAMERMVDVLLYNKHRLVDLWTIFLSHVLEVLTNSKGTVRVAAVATLRQAVLGILNDFSDDGVRIDGSDWEMKKESKSKGVKTIENGSGLSCDSEKKAQEIHQNCLDRTRAPSSLTRADLEHMLLVALESIYLDHTAEDVRHGMLRIILAILQRQGDHLSDGWTPIFRMLATIPTEDGNVDAENINLGFEALQMISSEYLGAFTFAQLKRCLEVAAVYGLQQADVNVSLTTITLLWNVADMLGRSGIAAENVEDSLKYGDFPEDAKTVGKAILEKQIIKADKAASTKTGLIETKKLLDSPGKNSVFRAVSSPQAADELIRFIFSVLESLSRDDRPEVRNSGLRTLFAVVVAQGPRLSRKLWDHALWDLLFPLLRHAFHMSATSSKEETEAALLGKARGEQIRLVVHHSRNTAQKQWDETVVVAVGGMSRLFRAHLPAIAPMDGMEDGWDELMIVIESSLAGGRKEVALAGIHLLNSVLLVHGSDDTVVTKRMWKRALRAIDVGVQAATSAGCQVPLAARLEIVTLIGDLFSSLRSRFDHESCLAVLYWAEEFCRNPWSEDDINNPVQIIGMPPVQKSALVLWERLTPSNGTLLWLEYFRRILKLLDPTHVISTWREQQAPRLQIYNSDSASEGNDSGLDAVPLRSVTMKLSATPGPIGRGAIDAPQPPLKAAQHRLALNSTFLEKLVTDVLTKAFEVAPAVVKIEIFAPLLDTLSQCMQLRYSAYQDSLWRVAASSSNRFIKIGIATFDQAADVELPDKGDKVQRAWNALANLFESFLLGPNWLRYREHSNRRRADVVSSEKVEIGKDATVFEDLTSSSRQEDNLRRVILDSGVKTSTDKDLPVVPILEVPSGPRGRNSSSAGLPTRRPSMETPDAQSHRGEKDIEQQDVQNYSRINFENLDGQSGPLANDGARAKKGLHEARNLSRRNTGGTDKTPSPNENKTANVGDMHTSLSPERAREDAEIELSVLDTLTDVVLPGSQSASDKLVETFVTVIDQGIVRDSAVSIPQTLTGSNFSHVCVRKMYVLCSRADGMMGDQANLRVARIALPYLLNRCDSVLRDFASLSAAACLDHKAEEDICGDNKKNQESLMKLEAPAGMNRRNKEPSREVNDSSGGREHTALEGDAYDGRIGSLQSTESYRFRLEEVMCFLEVLASMTLVPSVVDIVLPEGDPLTEVVRALRLRPKKMKNDGRERTHLLLLYSALCSCISCQDPRVRELVMYILTLAGVELGLGVPSRGSL